MDFDEKNFRIIILNYCTACRLYLKMITNYLKLPINSHWAKNPAFITVLVVIRIICRSMPLWNHGVYLQVSLVSSQLCHYFSFWRGWKTKLNQNARNNVITYWNNKIIYCHLFNNKPNNKSLKNLLTAWKRKKSCDRTVKIKLLIESY